MPGLSDDDLVEAVDALGHLAFRLRCEGDLVAATEVDRLAVLGEAELIRRGILGA